ncbi:uncharacterized protein [Heptranchias perlo]|uniref:uncharacterized protein n=1 Tax=Heptranchias perlo TaxID=212740 RepID=UPI003559CCBA
MAHSARLLLLRKQAIPSIFLLCAWNLVCGHIRYSIPEELEHGAFVGNIVNDLGLTVEELSSRKFRIVSDSSKHYLDANVKSGILFANERIDREQLCAQSITCVLALEVVIENPVEQYRVDVDILDINDNSPSFPHSETRLEIAESTIPGTRFLLENAHDPDVGTNSIREYQLIPNEKFSLDVQSRGEWQLVHLILEQSLDREKQSTHQLLLRAIDGGSPEQSGTTQITITVLDSNDNAPIFQQSLYTAILMEDAPRNAMVIKLNATDLDYGSNSDIFYSFSSYNKERVRDLFIINPKSGEISVKGILDFEEADVYEINVEAKDSGSPPLIAHCTVRVNITDVNDNAPALSLNSVSNKIFEDVEIGTLIALISVTDRDTHKNGQTGCQISPNLPFDLKSSFRNSYRLVTKDRLDRENTPDYEISVICKDRGTPSLSTNKTIVVHVTDINDNEPSFLQSSYTIYVMENNPPGSSIGSVTALDPDVDQNSHLSYTILQSQIHGVPVTSYVSMNSEDGVIFSQSSFDYEQLKSFKIQIQAQDAGFPSLSNDVTVNVIILDQNDNSPVIISTGLEDHAQVPRSADAGYLVTKITASDADSGQNARLFYQLMQATDPKLFTVSHSSGAVRTTRRLKDNDVTAQRLVIQVKDNGHPPLSATATVTVTIGEKSAELNHDSVEPHRDLLYSSNLAFYIIIALGAISFILLLVIIALVIAICPTDRNPTYARSCFLTSCCCKSSLNATDRLQNVNLQNVPDSKLIANVLEVRGNGSISDTYRYKVRSATEPNKMEFMYLTSSSPAAPGSIRKLTRTNVSEQGANPTNIWTGLSSEIKNITEGLRLDCNFSFAKMAVLFVFSDHGKHALLIGKIYELRKFHPAKEMSQSDKHLSWMLRKPAIPTIFVLCVWNLVSGQIRYSIPEEQEYGAFVGKIAEDLGLSVEELSRRRFRIVSDSPTQYLDVNLKNGILFVNKRIDREQLCGQSLTCLLPLEVVIENPVEQYRAEVEILDINDNSPAFPVNEIRLEIPELATPGARFLLQDAHDPDVQVNSIRTYQLTPNDHFVLDVQSRGETKLPELVLEKTLDREKQSRHRLLLTALDGGSPERTGTAHVIITVLDTNDNAPVFQQSLYTVSLMEDVPSGTLVIKLNATDLDDGSNSDIVYSFSSYTKERARELFSINPFSGEIRLKGILDFEEASIYEIYVEAKDRGSHPISTHCTVQVTVKDVNDNAPNVTLNSVVKEVREDASTGTLIALINVRDRDSHENGYVDCQISPNLPFVLKSSFKNSYRLVSNDLLDRESAPEYKITVTCKDRGSPPLTTNKTLVVHISDINDNAPSFPLSSYAVYVMENNAPGSSIGTVTALDADMDQNSHLSYSILESHMQEAPMTSYVSINSENGVIYSQRTFDYEQLKSFQIHMQAQDAGVPLLSNNVTVNVIILDQNDNPPVITSPGSMNHSKIAVPRSADPGYLATKIIASDADSGQNARLFYQIARATDPSLFTVSHNSGEVRTARHFKNSDDTTQWLVIKVRDNGHPPLSATATVTLTVGEQNAEIPSDFGDPPKDLQQSSDLAFYIIIPLGMISFTLLVVILALVFAIWPINRRPAYAGSCALAKCCCVRELDSKDRLQNSNVNLQIVPDPKMVANVLEVRGNGSLSDTYHYKVRSVPQRASNEPMFFTPFSPATTGTYGRNTRRTVSERCGKVTNNWPDKAYEVSKIYIEAKQKPA